MSPQAPTDAHPPRGDARAFAARREAEAIMRRQGRRDRVLAALPEIGEVLRDLGASRVWVFGSVLGELFDEASDLDLAVEGLPPARFFPARVAVSAVCPIDFDLVELERAPESLRAHILAEGQELGP